MRNIQLSRFNNAQFEVVLIIDNKNISPLKYKMMLEPLGFRNVEVINTGNKPPSSYTMSQRRNRIAAAHNLAKDYIGGSHFVFGFEDDTVLPKNTIGRLLNDFSILNQRNNVGIIEGVQVGRWGKPYVGAWLVDDFNNPKVYKTILPRAEQIEEIDAGGLYCFLTPTQVYKEHEFKWNEPLGPDVDFGLSLRKKGYSNYIDWDIRCGHKTHGSILKLSRKTIELEVIKKAERWHYTEIKGVA